MKKSLTGDSEYWTESWKNRITPENSVQMNKGKLRYILEYLWNRVDFIGKEKLEIGCGTGIHAHILSTYLSGWSEKWTGLDLSEAAIEWAQNKNLNAHLLDIYEYETTKKFELFLLLDVFEHIRDRGLLARKIKGLADNEYTIFGNIPLYLSHGKFEWPVDVNVVAEFLQIAGCKYFWHRIYGISGFSYMLFEGSNRPIVKRTLLDEITVALPKVE